MCISVQCSIIVSWVLFSQIRDPYCSIAYSRKFWILRWRRSKTHSELVILTYFINFTNKYRIWTKVTAFGRTISEKLARPQLMPYPSKGKKEKEKGKKNPLKSCLSKLNQWQLATTSITIPWSYGWRCVNYQFFLWWTNFPLVLYFFLSKR